ncbi:helix-turn-helix domain-containing protein [Feifania hominis]|uniref:Helix-turn-helix transcriptional regulator n=1 Tax=Feifania hominis TaxID=2763660 RepID=A0A926HTI0_9FIRM|nr:helix-turn-helix transcriptional regulator [Feifania hominis]MBC8535894.1 helix-turn-helix transcriptional regulator [Feifania hominis]
MLTECIGRNIRRCRERKHYTQEQFANMAEISPAHLRVLERGRGNPTAKTLEKIARCLGVTLHELIREDEPVDLDRCCGQWVYRSFHEICYRSDLGVYQTYSLCARRSTPGEETIHVVHDVSLRREVVARMSSIFTAHHLSPVHFHEIVEYFLS